MIAMLHCAMDEANEKYLCIICGNTVMLMAKGTEPLCCCGDNMIQVYRHELSRPS